jgi:hypothetical protein
VTASVANAVLSRPKRNGDTETLGHADLRCQLATELLIGESAEEDLYESVWMVRGKQLQDRGLGEYEARYGELVQRIGFIKHDTLPIGCSPDGIVGDYDGGVEIKCPKLRTHIEYLGLNGKVPTDYQPQILHSLLVTDLPFWDFVSFHPALPGAARLYRVRVKREDVDLAAYELAVRLFWSEVEKTAEELRQLSAA